MSRLSQLAALCLFAAASVLALSGFRSHSPHRRFDQPAPVFVRVDSVGTRGFTDATRIRIYAEGPARFGLGISTPTPLVDTLQLSGLPAFTVDVSQSDVHVELLDNTAAQGASFYLGGSVTNGPARRVAASGRHLLVLKGGHGVRVLGGAPAR